MKLIKNVHLLFTVLVRHIYKKWVEDQQQQESKKKGKWKSRAKSKQQPATTDELPESLEPKGERGIRTRMRNRVKHFLEERRKWIRKEMGIDEKFYQAYNTRKVKCKENKNGATAAEFFEVQKFNNILFSVLEKLIQTNPLISLCLDMHFFSFFSLYSILLFNQQTQAAEDFKDNLYRPSEGTEDPAHISASELLLPDSTSSANSSFEYIFFGTFHQASILNQHT